MPQRDYQAPPITPDVLRSSRLFDGLTEATLITLARELRSEIAQPGQLLMHEGDIASHMFIVLSGEVEVVHKGGADHDVRVALLGPGDFIGEMAVLDAQPRSASVRALAPSALLRISASEMKSVLADRDVQQYSILILNVARELSRRLRVADRVIANASIHIAHSYILESRRPPSG